MRLEKNFQIRFNMDYEKLYKDALERARNLHKDAIDMDENIRAKQCEIIFPELAESEDEKTKRILHSISSKISFHLRNIFTEEEFQCFDAWSNDWLEKQGEKKSSDEVLKIRQELYQSGYNDGYKHGIEDKFNNGE